MIRIGGYGEDISRCTRYWYEMLLLRRRRKIDAFIVGMQSLLTIVKRHIGATHQCQTPLSVPNGIWTALHLSMHLEELSSTIPLDRSLVCLSEGVSRSRKLNPSYSSLRFLSASPSHRRLWKLHLIVAASDTLDLSEGSVVPGKQSFVSVLRRHSDLDDLL